MRISDWSSDVCSSDLHVHGEGHFRAEIARHGLLALTARRNRVAARSAAGACASATGDRRGRPPLRLDHRRRWRCIAIPQCEQDRKSVVEGKSVSVRVDLGGRRIINKKITLLTIISLLSYLFLLTFTLLII